MPPIFGCELAVALADPAAVPTVLVLPVLGVADAGLGLDVVEPGVFHALAVGPNVLAGDGAGVTPDALVEVQHHGDLRADFHSAASILGGAMPRDWPLVGGRAVEPVDLGHLAHDHELVAIGADGAVVVEAVGLLGVAADHVRRLHHDARNRIVDAAALAGHLRARHVHDLLLRVIHHAHALLHTLRDDSAGDQRTVGVVGFDPVVIDDAGRASVLLADPHDRPATAQGEHQQVVGVGGVDAPLLVRRDEVEDDLLLTVGLGVDHRLDRARIDRRAIDAQRLTERAHPQVILVELLAARERAPGDQLVHVGVTGVVADLLRLQPGPDRRGDDLARLGDHVAEADLLVLLRDGEMGVLAPGESAQRGPCLDRHLAVGLGRQRQDHLGRVDVALDPGQPLRRPLVRDDAIQALEEVDLVLGVPGHALAAVAEFRHERSRAT